MLRRSIILALALLVLVGAASYGAEEIKIGLITSTTGDTATFGISVRNAALLWEKQVNARGGILGRQVKIYVEDDKGMPSDAANAALKLINQTKVPVIIGAVTSNCTLAAAPIAQANKVPILTPTSTNVTVTQIGKYVFRSCFLDPLQGQVMARFAVSTLKASTAAMLYDVSSDYSMGLAESFKKQFEALGGKVVASETYSRGESDFSAQLTKIKRVDPDVLWLPDYYNTVGLITRQARQLGIKKATFIGVDGWDSSDLVPLAGDSIEGGYFSNHYSAESTRPMAVAFIKAYTDAYKATPDALAALAYDGCLVVEDAIRRAGKVDSEAITSALATTKNVEAVSGVLTLDADRNPIKDAVVLQVKGGKFVYVTSVSP
ncbi:MAG: Leucine-, isoleucine-, valine-, threonine-, and alanine-binding protein precursor [Firmicutes bacterium ADurb.Bin506]|nr:MAG: Leucine-, isoleucine-, valine-, threonine-, and alanine-binding protein precursor [Firmicutes bacterium ADurb.Bin506]